MNLKQKQSKDELRKAIPPHKTDLSDGPWDGPKARANLKNDGGESYYHKASAWADPEGDPGVKATYKFIHHEVSADGTIGAANIKGCQSSIAVLNGARGGTTIPGQDMSGVYAHAAGHLKDGDIEPPELKKLSLALEERHLDAEDSGLRILEGEKPKIFGYAAVFESLSVPLAGGAFREKIKAGAFSDSIKEMDVKCLFNHDDNFVLGRTGNYTLNLKEDDKGLYFEVLPPETQWAADLMVSIGRKDIYQGSFQFKVLEDSWDSADPENVIRTLLKVKLIDVSVVSFPAYPQTVVDLRSDWEVYKDYAENLKVQQDLLLKSKKAAKEAQERTIRLREEDLKNIHLEETRWKSYLKS